MYKIKVKDHTQVNREIAEVAHLVERKPSKLQVAGSSPVFRSQKTAAQTYTHAHTDYALPSHPDTHPLRRCSSVVEHFLGKEGVMSSSLIIGSTSINMNINCN